jgi:hypothetical protein
MLQISKFTAIALVMLSEGASRDFAEEALGHFSSLLVAHGCKLYRCTDARGDHYFAIDGYDRMGRDVDRALAAADKLTDSWDAAKHAAVASSWDPDAQQPNWSRS